MSALKRFYLALLHLANQVRLLPHTIMNASKERQRQTVLDELEVERLDRIRNPSKYLGK